LLLKLLLKHRSHNNSLSELLLIITLTNTNNITRTRQTKHIKDKAEAITVAKVFREVLEAVVTSEAVTVFGKI
jgi:phosphoribosylpyrophosphate synthetase